MKELIGGPEETESERMFREDMERIKQAEDAALAFLVIPPGRYELTDSDLEGLPVLDMTEFEETK